MGKPIVMGRLTHESIGKPLPGRQNIVITRQQDYIAAGCDVVGSPEEAVAAAGDAREIMVIGGGKIYRAFLPLATRIYLTRVDAETDGDAYFPALDSSWHETSREAHTADVNNEYDFAFVTLDREETP